MATAVAASLSHVKEGAGDVPQCTDCAFKLAGPYRVTQFETYASLALGGMEVARYGWAYVNGIPMRPGEEFACPSALYVAVVNGILQVSCSGTPDAAAPAAYSWPVDASPGVDDGGPGRLRVPYMPTPPRIRPR